VLAAASTQLPSSTIVNTVAVVLCSFICGAPGTLQHTGSTSSFVSGDKAWISIPWSLKARAMKSAIVVSHV